MKALHTFCVLAFTVSASALRPVDHPNTEDKGHLTVAELQESSATAPGPDFRLPGNLIPENYFIRIRPVIDRNHTGVGPKDRARSYVRITAKCVDATDKIILHQKFLTINETSIQIKNLANSASLEVTGIEYDPERDFMIMTVSPQLTEETRYEIVIGYYANVPPNDSLRGLYSESYFDPLTNQTKFMAATQLEPLRARQVFPCFDEPTYKATIDLTVGRSENFTSLGNGPLIGTSEDPLNPGWFWDVFNTTVPMPTYLFAMAVSEYGYNEAEKDLYRLPVRVYGPPHLVNEGKAQLSADGSAMLMNHFEQKYGIAHGMPKVDSISVPYKRGAMENYGLITYGEYLLMYHEGVTLDTELRQIYHILAHELGHQWFGNLVTCKWWSDIYLNEGFATYVSFEGVNALWPRFDMMNFMIVDTVNVALKFDATSGTHPIHQEAYDASEISRNMDTIGYDKGGSIVRLMVNFLGEDIFYSGIRNYLQAHQDSVADQDDLFKYLDEAASEKGLSLPVNVTQIMHTWTLQKGYPLVRASLNGDETAVVISQEPWQNAEFRLNSSVPKPNESWDIPVRFQVGNSPQQDFWLLQSNPDPETVSVQLGTDWVLLNSDAGGYYRTLYDSDLRGRLAIRLLLNHTEIPVPGRIRLLDDQFVLGLEKYIPIGDGLTFTRYLMSEDDPNVWATFFANMQQLRLLWAATDNATYFEAMTQYYLPKIELARARVEEQLKRNPNEASAISILHSQLVDWSCAMNSKYCEDLAKQLFETWNTSPQTNPVPNNLQTTLYCKIVDLLGEQGFTWILQEYRKPGQTRSQKSRLVSALGCTRTLFVNATELAFFRTEMEEIDSVTLLQRIISYTFEGRVGTLTGLIYAHQFIGEENYGWTVDEFIQVFSSGAMYFSTDVEPTVMAQYPRDIFANAFDSTIAAGWKNVEFLNDMGSQIYAWLLEQSA